MMMSVQPSFCSSPRKTARRDCTCRSLSAAAINTPIRRILPDCCAPAASGHAAAALRALREIPADACQPLAHRQDHAPQTSALIGLETSFVTEHEGLTDVAFGSKAERLAA